MVFFNGLLEEWPFEMPAMRSQPVGLDDLKLIRFSSVVHDETRDLDATVHFFEPDERFDEVWKTPEPYLAELGQYRQVMSPDFSLYTNMPITHSSSNLKCNTFPRLGSVHGLPGKEGVAVAEGYSHLSVDERVVIEQMGADGASMREIGRALGRSASTVSREVGRGLWSDSPTCGEGWCRRR